MAAAAGNKRPRDQDEVKRKHEIRMKYRKIIRTVAMNRNWLMETEDQAITMNVRKNVAMIKRKKSKPGVLSNYERALIRSTPWSRSIKDRKRLCGIMTRLLCFQKLPPVLRARMIPYIKYLNVGPDRIIIKQGQDPITLYFIITGEVEMKRDYINKKTGEPSTDTDYVLLVAGDWIGEAELLEDIPRMHTYTSRGPLVELLCLYDYDYYPIMEPYMKKLWQDKKNAIRALEYFNYLDEEQMTYACRYASLAQYEPLDTIYFEDNGPFSAAYFVLSGECSILQLLNMKWVERKGKRTLVLSSSRKTGSNTSILSETDVINIPKRPSPLNIARLLESSTSTSLIEGVEEPMSRASLKRLKRLLGLREVEKNCKQIKLEDERREKLWRTKDKKKKYKTIKKARYTYLENEEEDFVDFYDEQVTDSEDSAEAPKQEEEDSEETGRTTMRSTLRSTLRSSSSKLRHISIEFRDSTKSTTTEGTEIYSTSSLSGTGSSLDSDDSESSSSTSLIEPTIKPVLHESHYIDVGSLTYGGLFGLGERQRHRVYMARTIVQCLLIPRYWLMKEEQNPSQIWQRRRFFLECRIPTREFLFDNFLKTRHWAQFQHDFVKAAVYPISNSNDTKPEDIPEMLRIIEYKKDVDPNAC